jgi:hypothetical protein
MASSKALTLISRFSVIAALLLDSMFSVTRPTSYSRGRAFSKEIGGSMTAAAALETWNETGLRRELLRIARHRKGSDREKFYSQAWALITRLRAGKSPEFYLARVVTGLCTPKAPTSSASRVTLRSVPTANPKALPCHWNVADTCVGADCIHFIAHEKTCARDNQFFERLYGPGATGPVYE